VLPPLSYRKCGAGGRHFRPSYITDNCSFAKLGIHNPGGRGALLFRGNIIQKRFHLFICIDGRSGPMKELSPTFQPIHLAVINLTIFVDYSGSGA
jgi:hypothetical protein